MKRRGPYKRTIRLAYANQLWVLNAQGVLRLELPTTVMPAGEWDADVALTQYEADSAIKRVLAERWPGLGRWPKAGESWTVQDGIVLPVPPVEEPS